MKHRSVFWGIFLLAAAVFIIIAQTVTFVAVGFWSIVATVFLVATLIGSITEEPNFFGIFVSIALLYEIYQGPYHWPVINVWILLLAAVLAASGCHAIFHPHWHNWNHQWQNGCGGDVCNVSSENLEGEQIFSQNSFSESCKYLHSDNLKVAKFTASFGKMDVYFDQVTLDPAGAFVDVSSSFGKMTLYLPSSWRVVNNVHASFGAVTNNMRPGPLAPDAPVLTIRGSASFGELEIRSI